MHPGYLPGASIESVDAGAGAEEHQPRMHERRHARSCALQKGLRYPGRAEFRNGFEIDLLERNVALVRRIAVYREPLLVRSALRSHRDPGASQCRRCVRQ